MYYFAAESSQRPVERCLTVKGNQCRFPFRLNGILNDACLPHMNGGSWCSINTDENSNHIHGDENWEYCGPLCPLLTDLIPRETSDMIDSFKKTYSKFHFHFRSDEAQFLTWKTKFID